MIFLVKALFHSLATIRTLPMVALSTVLLISLFVPTTSTAQVTGEGPRWFGSTGKSRPYDTAAIKEARERTLESAGLMDGPIDPITYRIGPNDFLSITVWTQETRQYETIVTPDAKVLIPTVGAVDVRNATLAEATDRIQKSIAKQYRVNADVSLLKMREFKVNVIGAVNQPGSIIATPATRVSEAIDLVGGALPRADRRHITLYRKSPNGPRQEILVDLLYYYSEGDLNVNPTLLDGDVIRVNIVDPVQIVQISGKVKAPGEYTWHEGDSISSIIRAAFGFTVDADTDSIEVVSVGEKGDIISRTFHSALPDGRVTNDRKLQISDRIFVRPRPQFRERNQVVVDGEVQKPGFYPIVPGQTRLRTLIEYAGGFTEDASILDARLIRRQATNQDDEYFAYVNAIESERRTPEEAEYFRTKFLENRTQGSMTIDFRDVMNGDEEQNLLLIDDDSLYVPERVNYIRISGKVKNPGNFLHSPDYTYQDYIAKAGGYGWRAEINETQIIKGRTGDRLPADDEDEYTIEPGDVIFVPEEKPSNFWEGFATTITIVAQVATIIAVVVSVVPNQ